MTTTDFSNRPTTARLLAANLPDEVLETLRERWGNTNVAVIKHWRDEVKTALAGGGPVRPPEAT